MQDTAKLFPTFITKPILDPFKPPHETHQKKKYYLLQKTTIKTNRIVRLIDTRVGIQSNN